MFFLSCRHTDDDIFDDFPKISDHFPKFPKILQNLSKGHKNVTDHFPNISEDHRRLPKIFKEDPKMFRSYTNKFKFNLRDKPDICEIIDIFTSDDMENTPLESWM